MKKYLITKLEEFNESYDTDSNLLGFVEDALKDTIFKYESRDTKYTKKGYLRFVSTHDSYVLYISKNRIVLLNQGRFNFSVSKEKKESYRINDKVDFIEKLQRVYDYVRFFGEHYPEPGTKYSLKDGSSIPKVS